ncbi:hypothetical protein [Marichromatium bheemlicum]|uniref:Uncharacterized protein n=1 Tax=Marichromatium bheemlicum TaxID=365339 RepID=A0ABX1I686_9GAMM|nr:hypothetical protein [Marichromatium bheemlicum]NKN31915.1 hypothetical protein [Marichromatium bheemlicum]
MNFSFDNLVIHSESIKERSIRVRSKFKKEWVEAVDEFSKFYVSLETSPKSTLRNVKLLLSTRFFNHVFSSLTLAEAGLLADAIVCERSSIETLAGYKLVCVAPDHANKYNTDKFPKPVEVRKKLESLGFTEEVENIRGVYKSASGITHLNRDHERFSMDWENENTGVLNIGGAYDQTDIEHMIWFLPKLIHWYLMPIKKNG